MPETGQPVALHYLDTGDTNTNHTVICVHGLTRNAHDFDFIAEALAERGKRVIALDMPGRGDSPPLEDASLYDYSFYVPLCLAFLNQFHLRQVSWIGTSMGGIIGMMLAASQPGRIKKLVLNDVGAFIPADGLREVFHYVDATPERFESREAAEALLHANMQSFGIEDEAHWQHVLRHGIVEEGAHFRLNYDRRIIEVIKQATNDFADIEDVDLSAVYEPIDIPVLVVHGAKSVILQPETVRSMRASNPRCQALEVPGVGHAPMLMALQEIQPVIDWLEDSRPAANLRASG